MSTLDSRNIEWGFVQKITSVGTLKYTLSSYGLPSAGPSYSIIVQGERNRSAKSWYIPIEVHDNHLAAATNPTQIAPGDLLHWHIAEGHKMRFCVVGSSTSKERFDSRAISDNAVYIHRFGLPELVEWVDAAGHGISGKIKVGLPKMETSQDRQHYEEALATPQLITIEGRSTKPKNLDVFVGQPVFFVVRKSHGISIVDKAVLEITNRATRRKDSN